MPFPTAQQINLPACSPPCPFMLSVQQGSCKYQFSNDWLTRLGIKPECTATEYRRFIHSTISAGDFCVRPECKYFPIFQGPLRVACLSNGSWKQKPPTCVCPSCLGGKNCDQPMTWNDTVAAMHKTYQTEGVSDV